MRKLERDQFPPEIRWTPWDEPQTVYLLGNGVHLISTAGHGGLHLYLVRWIEFKAAFPAFQPWAGAQWLEEDADICAAIVLWPELFPETNRTEILKNLDGCFSHNAGTIRAYVEKYPEKFPELTAKAA